ncbi:uncharacterized 30.3 kDa protein-like [Pieris brassicae]|uniref:uncharacterized 30.3 kDa protein-like n=1 Tax=Pieris brassicae TaxID=7116 RepID=UPI001E65F2D3|nr:uncharacterized 30.3 kDa protein-like [Pieris brassicae]
MEAILYYYLSLVTVISYNIIAAENYKNTDNEFSNETVYRAYQTGVDVGIINTEKYPFLTFQSDERNIFRGLFREYTSLNASEPINYEEWLIMNNFGILPDTQESLFERKIAKRSTADNKRRFVNTVRKGDILITGRGVGGLIGHAAIMTTDYWVLEMPGGRGWQNGIKDNNRQISKHAWFDVHSSDWTTVYRNRDASVAHAAALWADHNYYNPSGGAKKTIHVTYKITTDIKSKNPSYCSKLVIQAYYFGTGKRKVISNLSVSGRVIVPTNIPIYFMHPYTLVNKGKY